MKLLTVSMALILALQVKNSTITTGRAPDPPATVMQLPESQRDAIAQADHKKNLEEAEALLKLAEELKSDLDNDDAHIVSVKSMKKTEDIEKLAKNIRRRLKRY
jgi:hypothetical protein